MTEQYFKHTSKAAFDTNLVESLAIEVDNAFLEVEKNLWKNSVNTSSIGSSIGDLDTWYLHNYSPDNGIIRGYSQELYFPKYSKEASLDLVPDISINSLNKVSIKNRLDPSMVYTYKHNGKLETDTDFCFVNRKIILGQSPNNSRTLTVSYDGYEPVDTKDVGLDLRFNVLQTTVNGIVIKEFLNTKNGNTYKIQGYNFKDMCSKELIYIINNRPYDLNKYMNVYNIDGDTSYTIDDIVITNSYISFTSEDIIPEKVKIYVANSNLGKLIEGIYRLFYSHNHGADGGKLVSHSDLTGLFNNKQAIEYSVTSKENYDHPQYLNREGYIEAPEVYNNAMLGDLLVSSKDKSNYYNNLSDDSFKIIFGEYASGHRIGFSKETDSLVIDSLSRDGVKLVSPKNKNILELNEHNITDLVDGEFSGVRLSIVPTEVGAKEVAVFSIKRSVMSDDGVNHEDSAELQVYSSTFSITKIKDNLRILDKAVLTFGTIPSVKISHDNTGLIFSDVSETKNKGISLTLPLKTTTITADHIDAKRIHITDAQRLVFGDSKHTGEESQYLSHVAVDDQVVLSTRKPLVIKQNGYNSGFQLGPNTKFYASNSSGLNTTNTSEKLDFYLQTSGDTYLIKNGDYSAGAINLQTADRSNLYTGDLTANNINIPYSELKQNSLKLNGESHKIFAQKDTLGNTGIQLQSSGGVNIISGYNVNSSNISITYGVIRAAEFRVEGGGDNSGFYGNVIVPSGSKLTVNGEALFNTEMTLNTNLTVKGNTTLNTIDAKSIKTSSVTASESIVTPMLTAPLGFDSKLFISADSVFNNSATFKQVCTFTANCNFAATIGANTVTTKFLNVTSAVEFPKVTTTDAVVSSTLQFKKMLQTDNNVTSEFAGPLLLKAGLGLDRNTSIRLGSSDINNTRNTSGVLITENSVKMGNNSTVKTTKVFANKGIPTGGNSDITGGYSFETNLGSSDGDTGLFCTDKGNAALADDLVFYINGEKRGEISTTSLDLTKSITGREKTLVTAEMIKGQMDSLLGSVLNMVYPLGTVYINANDNRNPKEVLNWNTSVWARFAIGMTMVGAEGASNSERMAAMWNKPNEVQLIIEKEFGEFKHQLTEAELPEHDHGYAGDDQLQSIAGAKYKEQTGYDAESSLTNKYPSGWYKTTRTGGNQAHNNVQPSVVVAIWRRIG